MNLLKQVFFLVYIAFGFTSFAQFTERQIIQGDERYMKKDKKSDWALKNWVLRNDIEDAQYTIYWDKEKTVKASFIWKHEGEVIGITHYNKNGLIKRAVHFYSPYRALMATQLDSLHYSLRYYDLWEGPKTENIIPNITHTKSYFSGFYEGNFNGYVDYYNIDEKHSFTEYYKDGELVVKDYYNNKKLCKRTYEPFIYEYYSYGSLKSVLDTNLQEKVNFYKNGSTKEEGIVFNNEKLGWWKNYNKKGELIDSTHYGNYPYPAKHSNSKFKIHKVDLYPFKSDTVSIVQYVFYRSNPQTECEIRDVFVQLYSTRNDSSLSSINEHLLSNDYEYSDSEYDNCFVEEGTDKLLPGTLSFTKNLYKNNPSSIDTSLVDDENYEGRIEEIISYTTNYFDSTLYSMSYNYWTYYGGMHGNFGETPYIFDLSTGQLYDEDIFKTDSVSYSKLIHLIEEKIGFEPEGLSIGKIGLNKGYIYIYYAPYTIGGWQPIYAHLNYAEVKDLLCPKFSKSHASYIKNLMINSK